MIPNWIIFLMVLLFLFALGFGFVIGFIVGRTR